MTEGVTAVSASRPPDPSPLELLTGPDPLPARRASLYEINELNERTQLPLGPRKTPPAFAVLLHLYEWLG